MSVSGNQSPATVVSTSPAPVRVAIVEDDDRIRAGLVELIDHTTGMRCVSANASAEEALACPWIAEADVVLMDINLPGLSGIECVQRLKQRQGKPEIMMLTVYEDTDRLFESLKHGASGYLLKRTPPEELIAAIRELHQGGSPMSGRIARKVVGAIRTFAASTAAPLNHAPAEAATATLLTAREQAVLESLAKGFLYKEIAEAHGVSLNTIRSQIHSIYEKLQVQTRTEAVLRFLGK